MTNLLRDKIVSVNQDVTLPKSGKVIQLKREDLLHSEYGGNKLRKLRYNLLKAKQEDHDTILTFGGAWSNHIYSTAAACKEFGFKSIGVIRGEEPENYSDTLEFAKSCRMKFHFVSRNEYREKDENFFTAWLHDLFGRFYRVPEGGSNYLGVQGCSEILTEEDRSVYDIICCACGTGATLAGIALSSSDSQIKLGFPALKDGEFLLDEVRKHLYSTLLDGDLVQEYMSSIELNTDYHFGGYAKVTDELVNYLRAFNSINDIKLDPIYTGKMMFGIDELIHAGQYSDERILAIHSGGLQGITGIEKGSGERIY